MPSICCSDLTFSWPDGSAVLDGLDLALGPGRTGLIGVNGAGKSTLLRLIAGELTPLRGTAVVDGAVAYLPQHVALRSGCRVDDVLGIAETVAAIRAVEAGDASQIDAVDDRWDIEERARATLDRLGLPDVRLDRAVETLSGGESVALALAGLLLCEPGILLLDEPTNNLDLDRRTRLYDVVDRFPGLVLVISHDRVLLEHVDQIADLRDGAARVYGGTLSDYERLVAGEQEAARRNVRVAEADVRRQRRELADARTKLDRRARTGRRMEAQQRVPKIIAHARKRQAQVSAGKLRDLHAQRLATAEADLDDAAASVRDDDAIRIDLPDTAVPSRRTVLSCQRLQIAVTPGGADLLWGRPVDLHVRGPERIALTGANGTGKTMLLRAIVGLAAHAAGSVDVGVDGVGYLPQRLDVLDGSVSLLENLRRFAPAASDNELRARLARFAFRGDRSLLPVSTLSGGERFRATLATLLGARPPPQLLVLDEPTNNLDIASVRQLEQALAGYQGALIVASHDLAFLDDLVITRWMRLNRAHGLTEIDRPTTR